MKHDEEGHLEVSAALCRLEVWDDDTYYKSPHARWFDVATVRQALTASGVPYVPESMTTYNGYVPPEDGDAGSYYVEGWNDCRQSVLDALAAAWR